MSWVEGNISNMFGEAFFCYCEVKCVQELKEKFFATVSGPNRPSQLLHSAPQDALRLLSGLWFVTGNMLYSMYQIKSHGI